MVDKNTPPAFQKPFPHLFLTRPAQPATILVYPGPVSRRIVQRERTGKVPPQCVHPVEGEELIEGLRQNVLRTADIARTISPELADDIRLETQDVRHGIKLEIPHNTKPGRPGFNLFPEGFNKFALTIIGIPK